MKIRPVLFTSLIVLGLFVVVMLTIGGCAFVSQEKYYGTGLVLKELVIQAPNPMRHGSITSGGQVVSYFDARVTKRVSISNGSNVARNITLRCEHAFPTIETFVVPAHTTQFSMVETTGRFMYDNLCMEFPLE